MTVMLDIVLEEPPYVHSFRPSDSIRGRAEIRGHVFKKAPKVTADFQGKLHASPGKDGCFGRLIHTIFTRSKHLDLQEGFITNENMTAERCYLAPFEFAFPSSNVCAACTTTTPCQLPPSLDSSSSDIRINISYTISVTVRYWTFYQVVRIRTATRELLLNSMTPTLPPPVSCIASLPANKLVEQTQSPSDGDFASNGTAGWLPRYSPALQIELRLLPSPVLTRGRVTSIELLVYTPPEILRGQKIYIRSVCMQLQSSTTAHVGRAMRRTVQTGNILQTRGFVHIDKERFELNFGDWALCMVVNARPTCVSCILELRHSVEVSVGISRGTSDQIQYARASLDVSVVDPPPEYELDDSGHPNHVDAIGI